MRASESRLAIGLMSGTSMDGIDAALIRTDGVSAFEPLADLSVPYDEDFRRALRRALGGSGPDPTLSREVTERHARAVGALVDLAGIARSCVSVVGFHGHTLFHDPAHGRTVQIGDGARLARSAGIDVVDDFRSADMAAGGQGAPLAPLFHAVLAPDDRPVCFLNIGGVANLTWIGAGADPARPDMFAHLRAFDTGPGGALIDDWIRARTGEPFDRDGRLAASGRVAASALSRLLEDSYFRAPPPKSLDRGAFDISPLAGLSAPDGAATLTAFTAEAVARAVPHLPEPPVRWLVTGGGRRNRFLMESLRRRLAARVEPGEAEGLDGDVLEAQAFAYLAVRSLDGRALSGPTTTGAAAPTTGGRRHSAD